jgi:hypothetical protein
MTYEPTSDDALAKKVINLIKLKREGVYWDFKEKHHEDPLDLLHDIICMANSLHDGDRYIIYGVENKAFDLVGLDDGRAKTQAQLLDFLSKIPFVGDIRPEIELRRLAIQNKEIDVLVILNRPLKPYILSEDYHGRKKSEKPKNLRAHYIYGRVNDKNTAIDSSSDLHLVEKMWKQRFGLDLPIADQFRKLLQNRDEWYHQDDQGNGCPSHIPHRYEFPVYHERFPEFTVELTEREETDCESFFYFFPNQKAYFGQANFKYRGTVMFRLHYVFCDEMRILIPMPHTFTLFHDQFGRWFYYYLLDNDTGLFLKFLRGNFPNLDSGRGVEAPILIFKNQNELDAFVEYSKENKSKLQAFGTNLNSNFRHLSLDDKCYINGCFVSKIHQFYKKYWDNPSLIQAAPKSDYQDSICTG